MKVAEALQLAIAVLGELADGQDADKVLASYGAEMLQEAREVLVDYCKPRTLGQILARMIREQHEEDGRPRN